MSEAARQRAKEYLKNVAGIEVDRLQPLVWPEDAVSAYRKYMYAPWEFTYKSDILRRKIEKMEEHLYWKRERDIIYRKPLYIWVFWCPGINGLIYRGWWLYLEGLNISEALDFRRFHEKLISEIMELFPLVDKPLFGKPDLEDWKGEFVKRYPCGRWGGRPQGKAPVWAEVQGSSVLKILGRAEWPKQKQF